MSIRSEIEIKVANWAATQTPPITVAYEGVPFVRDKSPYVEVIFLDSNAVNPSIDAVRRRTRGVVQINVCVLDGHGSKDVDALSEAIVNLFPVVPKTGTVSIEQTPSESQALLDGIWRIVPVMIKYRYES